MFFYYKKENCIEVYYIVPKSENLKKYRKSELKKVKEEKLFYLFKSNEKNIIKLFKDRKSVNIKNLNSDELFIKEVSILNPNNFIRIETRDKLIESYIEGKFSYVHPIEIFEDGKNSKKQLQFLLAPDNMRIQDGVLNIENILNLPRSLYILQLFEIRKFELLQNEDITKYLKLFNIK